VGYREDGFGIKGETSIDLLETEQLFTPVNRLYGLSQERFSWFHIGKHNGMPHAKFSPISACSYAAFVAPQTVIRHRRLQWNVQILIPAIQSEFPRDLHGTADSACVSGWCRLERQSKKTAVA
jgi:hypothetical protein